MVKLDIPKLKMLVFENDWCAQCYTERPIIHRFAIKYHDQLEVEVLNADNNPLMVKKYNVLTAPSIILIKNDEMVERISRFIDQNQLETVIRYYL
ncbi:thioredoxin family protein [Lactiplantibacillus plantarum]|uniref:thioredoxin family protein n=1 Tax=Lactiplantibacillus plantarum TaxID=1590 RepID=UPI0027423E7C|nr:thioredoxin family protein [Lactiplantibacillus plantarum]WLT36672.1 thioredoxin family protein [Lactiplantibacillus plantarum]